METMPTNLLVNMTALKLGKDAFIDALDAIGWRGDYAANPQDFLKKYIDNMASIYREEADNLVRKDMIHALNLYGFDLIGNEIVDIVPR